jgi:hypothetical protein
MLKIDLRSVWAHVDGRRRGRYDTRPCMDVAPAQHEIVAFGDNLLRLRQPIRILCYRRRLKDNPKDPERRLLSG